MTGPEHYLEAEKCIGWAQTETERDKRTSLQARAQVHATLALAAATVGAFTRPPEGGYNDWREVTQ